MKMLGKPKSFCLLTAALACLMMSPSYGQSLPANVIDGVHNRVKTAANAAALILKADFHRREAERLRQSGQSGDARAELQAAEVRSSRQKSGNLQVAVDLVLLDVSVQDRDGRPVRDLDQDNFKIFEEKIEQPITSFSAEESPVTWGLVLDRSSSMQGMMKGVYDAALNVIDEGTSEDEMFIMAFNNRTETVSELTSDRRQLANSIFGLRAEGATALYDAVDSGLDYLKRGKHRKKVLVVVTDGGDNKSRLRFNRLIDRVKESDVLIYAVGMYGGMAHNSTEARLMAEPQNLLRYLAEVTGAYAHFPADANKCREAMDKIAREVSEHYTIGYYPTNPAHDGRWRKLKVAVVGQPRTKYVVRTRSGYYAPGTER